MKMAGRAYRPGLLEATTPLPLSGAANGSFDQRFVVENGDRLVSAVGTAAGDDQREFFLGGNFGQ